MQDKCLHTADIATDVRVYDPRASGHEWATGVGGGFPCQAHGVVPAVHKVFVDVYSLQL